MQEPSLTPPEPNPLDVAAYNAAVALRKKLHLGRADTLANFNIMREFIAQLLRDPPSN